MQATLAIGVGSPARFLTRVWVGLAQPSRRVMTNAGAAPFVVVDGVDGFEALEERVEEVVPLAVSLPLSLAQAANASSATAANTVANRTERFIGWIPSATGLGRSALHRIGRPRRNRRAGAVTTSRMTA